MTQHVIHVERSGGTWEASFWCFDQKCYYRCRDLDPDVAARQLSKKWGIEKPRIIIHEKGL